MVETSNQKVSEDKERQATLEIEKIRVQPTKKVLKNGTETGTIEKPAIENSLTHFTVRQGDPGNAVTPLSF